MSIVAAPSGLTTRGFQTIISQNNFRSDETEQPVQTIDATFVNEDGEEIFSLDEGDTNDIADESSGELIAHYPLIENASDATGNFGPMILENTPFENGGIFSNGVYILDNQTFISHAETPYLSLLNLDAFTISAEFMVTENPILIPVFVGSHSHRWVAFYLANDGKMRLKYNNSIFLDSDLIYSLNTWHEARITFDNQTQKLEMYLDGELAVNVTVTELEHGNFKDIGITDFSQGRVFKGFLRNLKVYNLR